MSGRLPIQYSMSLQSVSFHSESHASVSLSGTKLTDYAFKKDRWRSNGYFIASMLGYCMTSNAYASFIKSEQSNDPNLLQYFVSYLLFGMPIVYMQIVLGQYTQMGMFYLKYCIPLFKGLAHTFMICVLLETILTGFIMTDALMYFLLTFQSVLPWSQCPEEYESLCIVNSSGLSDKHHVHKSYVFWRYLLMIAWATFLYITFFRYVYMDDPILQLQKVTTYDMPSMQRIVALLATWVLTFGIVCICYHQQRKFINVMMHIYIFGNFIVFLAVVTKKGAVLGLSKLLEMQVEDFYSAAVPINITVLLIAKMFEVQ